MSILLLILSILLCGCSVTDTALKNLKNKNLVGNGLVINSTISGDGINGLRTLIVSGEIQSVVADSNMLSYNKKETSSIFNSNSKTIQESLTITSKDPKEISNTLSKIIDLKK